MHKFFNSFFNKTIRTINSKIKRDNQRGIIPVIIDCELQTLNQYLEPVIEEMVKIKDKQYDFFFGETSGNSGSSYIYYNPENAFPVNFYPYIKGRAIFLSPHIYPKGPKNSFKIILDHAMCSAKFLYHPKQFYENYDLYFVTGKLNEEKVMMAIDKFGLQNKITVFKAGYPKLDKLLRGEMLSRNETLHKFGLNPLQKTILYAPSWEDGLSMREFGIDMVRTLLQDKTLNVIVKPHPCLLVSHEDSNYEFYTGGINWCERFREFSNNSNFVFIDSYIIDELLVIADIMVSDISSVSLEFLVLNKQVIYLDCPAFEKTFKIVYKDFNDISYKDLLENPMCNGGRHVGLVNYDYRKILEDVYFILDHPDYKLAERELYADQLLSNKGCASEKCAEAIVDYFNRHDFGVKKRRK
jgi:hypothetical protein